MSKLTLNQSTKKTKKAWTLRFCSLLRFQKFLPFWNPTVFTLQVKWSSIHREMNFMARKSGERWSVSVVKWPWKTGDKKHDIFGTCFELKLLLQKTLADTTCLATDHWSLWQDPLELVTTDLSCGHSAQSHWLPRSGDRSSPEILDDMSQPSPKMPPIQNPELGFFKNVLEMIVKEIRIRSTWFYQTEPSAIFVFEHRGKGRALKLKVVPCRSRSWRTLKSALVFFMEHEKRPEIFTWHQSFVLILFLCFFLFLSERLIICVDPSWTAEPSSSTLDPERWWVGLWSWRRRRQQQQPTTRTRRDLSNSRCLATPIICWIIVNTT